VVTVITDLGTVHRLWFIVLPLLACGYGESAPQTSITAYRQKTCTYWHTDRPAFQESRSKEGFTQWAGAQTACALAGSVRVLHMAEIVRMNSAGLPLQLAVVAGSVQI
jgi:hypothetical protein